ncbi:MAG: hypothetical protein KA716_01370 [Gloeotrichia echinulata DEX184]|nr:hypothetical protein [Gloeotrichia echinulata DEX184]
MGIGDWGLGTGDWGGYFSQCPILRLRSVQVPNAPYFGFAQYKCPMPKV